MGGYAGLAQAMAFATEFTKNATPHGHGFVTLANLYQHNSVETIAEMLKGNLDNLSPDNILDLLARITAFVEHTQREDHFDHEQHVATEGELETEWKQHNDGPQRNIYLSVRPKKLFDHS
eukprot:11636492-Karenia_brevis.AAC.1